MLKCECCCAPIDDHVCYADGSTFCSQGCARMAGAIEAEELGLRPSSPRQGDERPEKT